MKRQRCSYSVDNLKYSCADVYHSESFVYKWTNLTWNTKHIIKKWYKQNIRVATQALNKMTTRYMLQKLLKRLKSKRSLHYCHFKRTSLTLVQDVERRKEYRAKSTSGAHFSRKKNGGYIRLNLGLERWSRWQHLHLNANILNVCERFAWSCPSLALCVERDDLQGGVDWRAVRRRSGQRGCLAFSACASCGREGKTTINNDYTMKIGAWLIINCSKVQLTASLCGSCCRPLTWRTLRPHRLWPGRQTRLPLRWRSPWNHTPNMSVYPESTAKNDN